MGRFDELTKIAEEPVKKTSLLANEQTSKLVKQQTSELANKHTSKPVNQQNSKPINQQASKLVNEQTSELLIQPAAIHPLSTKEKTKYGTYLRDDSIEEIKVHAAQARRKSHEFLQDIVDWYFDNLKK